MAKPKGRIITEGRLRFGAAESATVVAATPLGRFKLFKILFDKRDGSIYVPFPYMVTKRGLLSEVDPSAGANPRVLELATNGVVVDYDVKFAHHTSGQVHFSKTGENDLLPRRFSYPLATAIGRVFEFHFFGLAGFETVPPAQKVRDAQITLGFERHPTSLSVAAEWRRKKDILDNTETPTAQAGPQSQAIRRSDGAQLKFLFLGQPPGYPLQEHLLFISFAEIANAKGADKPTTIFFGGWDAHEGKAPETQRMLTFMYPYEGPDRASKARGSQSQVSGGEVGPPA